LIAFKLGTAPQQQIAIATLREGRIVKRLSMNAAEVRSMALSADGSVLYYAARGAVWSLNVNDPASGPRNLVEGDDIALDAGRRILYVKQLAKDPPALLRVPADGGAAEPIVLDGNLRPVENPIQSTAVDAHGRFLFEVSWEGSFYNRTALFDPAAAKPAALIPVIFEGDTWSPVWTSDGRIISIGSPIASSLWRYHPIQNR
jgi:hypothetical protein